MFGVVVNTTSPPITCIVFQITIGRSTKDSQVDVDLQHEGPAWKIRYYQETVEVLYG